MDIKSIIPMWLRYRIMDLRGRGEYSLFADKHRCIFIHIPKAAGTSVAKTLFGQGSRHLPYSIYEEINRKKFNSYFKFAFVRNPWDRLVSTYFFLMKGGLGEMDRKWALENLKNFIDFDDFVRNWVNEESIWTWVHFIPQYYFIYDKNFHLKLDFLGKMENIEQDFEYIAQRLGNNARLQQVNRGYHQHYSTYYNSDTRDIVQRVYAKDIELFDYHFE